MPDSLSPVLSRVLPVWDSLSLVQRAALGVIAAVALGLAGFLASQGPEYAPVFSRLDDRDAAAIVAKLKEAKVPYRLDDGGATILVPATQVHEIRLQLAGEGLPQSGTVGMELFNQPTIGATEFTQKLNYQRALEGELARTIGKLKGVNGARVHLVLPQPALFSEQQKPTTASVVLDLQPAVQLTPEQIRGVTHLVATSVEGLTPENITLMSTDGKVLASGAGAEGAEASLEATATQLELQHGYERRVEQQVQDLLDRTLGPGKAFVSASVLLDWERVEANNEIYSPNNTQPQVRSSRTVEDTANSQGAPASGGVPGTQSNTASSYQQVGSGGASTSGHKETTQNFELSKTVEKVSRLPGSVKRLSVSVVLDSSIPADQVAELQKAIPAAVGLDSSRGDQVQIASVPFDKSFAEAEKKAIEEAKSQEQMNQYLGLARSFGLPVLGMLLLVVMAFIVTRRARPEAVPALAGSPVGAIVTEVIDDEPRLPPEAQRRRLLREKITTLAQEDPQAIAQVIRGWLAEEGR